jgi:membrane protease YdiL (CAAX protease family)
MLPEKPWKAEAVLQLGAGIFLCLFTGMLIVTALDRFLPALGKVEKNFLTFTVGVFFFQGAALGWIYFFLRSHGMGWGEAFGFAGARDDWLRVLKLAGLGIVVVLPAAFLLGKLAELALTQVGLAPELQPAVKMLQERPPAGQLVIYGAGAVFLAPLAEEMLFRGILYPTLKQSGYPRLALWASSLLFASSHLNLMAFVPLTFLALVLTWLYEKTANLAAPILTHLLFNAVNFALLVIRPSWLNLN